MGAVVYGIYELFFIFTRSVFIPLIIAIVDGIIVYFVIIFFMYSDHPDLLTDIPYENRIIAKIKRK